MYESTRNNKTVFSFKVTDTARAWQAAQQYMAAKYFRPHEEFRDLYYTTAPGLGMQYLQFFKTESEIQVVTFLGGPMHPVPLEAMQSQTADSVRTALKGLLEPLREMEQAEAAAAQAQPEPAPQPTQPAFVNGQAPYYQPTANEHPTTAPASTMPEDVQQGQQATFRQGVGSVTEPRTIPQDPMGTRYPYDPVNGGPQDRASNAVAGLVMSIIGLFLALLGMGLPSLGVCSLIPSAIALILSVNGRRSRRRGIATAGMVISLVAIAIVIFVTLVWFDIMQG